VAVSDGREVVATDRDGRYQLVTAGDRPFVFVSLPSGYRIPTQASGTARLFRRIEGSGEMVADFPLERLADPDDEHAFLLLADVQTQDQEDQDWFRRETVPDLPRTIKTLGSIPLFGIAGGDIAWDNLSHYDGYE
jgi:hypothetical protein